MTYNKNNKLFDFPLLQQIHEISLKVIMRLRYFIAWEVVAGVGIQ
jgi:hypothetical protein